MGRETLESGVVSELQRPKISKRTLSIVMHLLSSRFMANNYLTLLGYRLTFNCVSESQGLILVVSMC